MQVTENCTTYCKQRCERLLHKGLSNGSSFNAIPQDIVDVLSPSRQEMVKNEQHGHV